MSKTLRVRFILAGSNDEESLVVKIASEDSGSQGVGFEHGLYEQETMFYAEFGETVAKWTVVPFCWLAVCEPRGIFTLVLEDMNESIQGDQLEGCGEAEAAMAKFQAPFLANREIPLASPWIAKEGNTEMNEDSAYRQCLPVFLERYSSQIAPEHADLCRWLALHSKQWLVEPKESVLGIRHRDYRLDNILFPGSPNGRIVFVDF